MSHAINVFEQAEKEFRSLTPRPDLEIRFLLAGKSVCLKVGSDQMAERLARVFVHLEPAGVGRPDLTIYCWEQVALGSAMAFDARELASAGTFYSDRPVRVFLNGDDGVFQAYDPRRKLGLYRFPDQLPDWEAGVCRSILHWWAADSGLLFLHAAAIGGKHGGVLLVGASGSGKSTTALSSVGSDIAFAGDDYCLVDPTFPPHVYSVYNAAKANQNSISRLPRLAAGFHGSPMDPWGKTIVFIASHMPKAIIRGFPLRAIIAPKIVAGDSCQAVRLSAAEMMLALAPSTVFQLQGDRARTVSALTALARALPCWRVFVGANPDDAHAVLKSIIAGTLIAA